MNQAAEAFQTQPPVPQQVAPTDIADMLKASFQKQRGAYLADPIPDAEQRKQDLLALKSLLIENREAIIDAISQDYGNRSRHESLFAEIIAVSDGINDTIKHLKKWMKPQKRHVDVSLYPGAK
ncbi:MAG: hypothetical protein OQK01_03000, partial [Xanthomonadales bacterium]|nr:hypothetical protein [Xanthomonadales bacterium]